MGILVIILFSVIVIFFTLQHSHQVIENKVFFNSFGDIKTVNSSADGSLYDTMSNVNNWSDIEKEIGLSIDELREVTAGNEEGKYFILDGVEDEGLSVKEVKINYDKDDIFSVSLIFNFYGAYPVSYEKYYSFFLPSEDIIKIEELVKEEELVNLASVLEEKIRDNVINKREYVEINFNDSLDWFDEMTKDVAIDTQEMLNNFKITVEGITFYYNFDFPHVAKEIEPQGAVQISFEDLRYFLIENVFSLSE